jgi:hypothetical protein
LINVFAQLVAYLLNHAISPGKNSNPHNPYSLHAFPHGSIAQIKFMFIGTLLWWMASSRADAILMIPNVKIIGHFCSQTSVGVK